MLALLLAIPLELRLAALFVIGLAVGAAVNWGIYTQAIRARSISPWSKKHKDAAHRQWLDFVPVLGWLALRREAPLHGRGFWVRPLLLELCSGVGLAALYWWEVTGHLVPLFAAKTLAAIPAITHGQFLAHAVLIGLMLVATFTDFDEQTIPDNVTIPGALLGLLFATIWPRSLLPEAIPGPPTAILNLLLTSPAPWFPQLNGWKYLAAGCLILVVWAFSLIPATTTLRYGILKGAIYYAASIRREFYWPYYALLAAVPIAGTVAIWFLGGPRWEALFTSLVGLAFGGGLVWAVRIVGRISLKREAMGFGDVTLMAMIGAFLGWQAALMVFFLSPLAAVFIAVAQWLATRRHDIAFGPYLCLAALGVIVFWDPIWSFASPYFMLGIMIPLLVGACLLMMMGMLMFWRFIQEMIFPETSEEDAESAT